MNENMKITIKSRIVDNWGQLDEIICPKCSSPNICFDVPRQTCTRCDCSFDVDFENLLSQVDARIAHHIGAKSNG